MAYVVAMDQGICIHSFGGREVLELRDIEPPRLGPQDVLVRVAAAGVNFIDVYQRSGAYRRPLPFVLGLEGAGVVEVIGDGVSGLEVGDRVAWAQGSASYATHVVLPAALLVPVPRELPLEVAAALMLQGMTAHYLCHSVRNSRPGDVALVHAAAGGTGQLLVQLLKQAGVRVLATCSTEAKAELARQAGADEVILYTRGEFAEEARALSDGLGVDVVYDSVGRATFDGSLRALKPRGLCVLFGQSSGAVPPFEPQRLNQGGSLFLTRPTLGHYIATREALLERANAVLSWGVAGSLRPRIHAQLPLAKAAEAHALLEGRQTTGKVLLLP